MPEMTMTEAARWAGKSRTTMFKAIKSGRISARKDDQGEYRIDPAELERVFRPAPKGDDQGHAAGEQSDIGERMSALQAENLLLREQLAKSEDREAKLLGVVESQTRLLADQRPQIPVQPSAPPRSGWRFWTHS